MMDPAILIEPRTVVLVILGLFAAVVALAAWRVRQ